MPSRQPAAEILGLIIGLTLTPAAVAGAPDILSLDVPPGSETQPVTRVYGDDALDRVGGGDVDAIAFGDVNGDGFDDVILGSPFAAHPTGAVGGEVYVIYGASNLPRSQVDLDTDGAISNHGETRIQAADWGDLLGFAVAAGDVDGDGFDDIAIGAVGAGAAGEVRIVFGAADLPGTIIDLATVATTTTIRGDRPGEGTGRSLATGDIDGDGFSDVVIGAPSADVGTVYVVYGNSDLRGALVDLDTDGVISAAGETRILGENQAAQTGISVATGDVNGDGFADVVIGANHASTPAASRRGAGYILYGGPSMRASTIDLGATPDAVGPAGETRLSGRRVNSWLGTSVATGDVDGDGFDDVAISSTGVTGNGDNFVVGEVYVVYGSQTLAATLHRMETPTATSGHTRITGTEESVHLGWSLALSDVDADGFDDLLLGAPESVLLGQPDDPTVEDGLVFLLRGGPTMRGRTLIDPREVADLAIVPDDPEDLWGYSAEAGGDLDRDGLADYAAAAFAGDHPSGNGSGAGYVAAVFGSTAPATTPRIMHSAAGNAAPTDFGPVLRAVVDFQTGTASTETALILRHAPATPPAGVLAILPVHWQLATDRGTAAADVTLGYTDSELGVVDEGRLAIFTSASGAPGSWSVAPAIERDARRNEIRTRGLDHLGFFAIAAVETPLQDLVFSDGFESGSTSAWSGQLP